MQEIKVKLQEIEPVLKSLKERTTELETLNPQIQFQKSSLELIDEIKLIEESYYRMFADYKTTLLTVEEDIHASITAFVKAEQDLAKQIKVVD